MIGRRALIHQLRPTLAAAGAVLLTTFALSPTLTDGPWLAKSMMAIAAVAIVGASCRALSLPAWGVVVAQGLSLVLLITVLFASEEALFGILPSSAVWRTFVDLSQEGNVVITGEIAPVTATAGIQFLVVGGVALVAWTVDAIAVSGRRAALAGIPLLALYLVPATVLPDGVPWPLFLAAGIGWLILLLEDGRVELARWGRPIDGRQDAATSGSGERSLHSVGGTGRRLGAAALTVAVLVPVILPSLDDGRFGGGSGDEGGGIGDGDGTPTAAPVVTVNPLTDLQRNLTRQEDTPVLFYTTDAQTPQYLRIATLDQFNGTTWTLEEMAAAIDQQASQGLADPPGLSESIAQTPVTYDITVGALDTPRLPLPYPVSKVDIAGDWRWDAQSFDVFAADDEGSAFAQQYVATALEVSPTVAQLQATPSADPSVNTELYRMLELPSSVEERLAPLAATVTTDATTDYDKALALQNWFRTEFDYSLDTVEGNDTEALDSFLKDRSGYCEQFAATMALMARTLDIPSRVQVGFTPGAQDDDGTWIVTVNDAHAWPELWFDGIGWIRFEPTPGGGDGGATPGWAPTPQDPTVPDQGGPRDNKDDGGVIIRRDGIDKGGRPADLREVLKANRTAQGGPSGLVNSKADEGGDSTMALWLLLIGLAGAAAAAPKTASMVARRVRWQSADTIATALPAAWADVLDAATDVDLRPAPTETPRDLAQRLPARGGLSASRGAQLRELAGWVERLRYRGVVDVPLTVAEIRQLADDIRDDLTRSISARDRRLARWWPTSGRIALIDGWNHIADRLATGWQRWATRRPRRAKLAD